METYNQMLASFKKEGKLLINNEALPIELVINKGSLPIEL